MVTGGLYITASRCEAIAFSDPIAKVFDAFIFKKGASITSYDQMAEAGDTFVTGAGYNQVQAAKDKGIKNVMEVPGPAEIIAAVMSGRAVAGGVTAVTAAKALKANPGLEMAPIPGSTYYVGLGFHKDNKKLKARINLGLTEYLGSEEMMKEVAEYDYTEAMLPDNETAAGACLMDANRNK
jgi:polar amino acid transport system substrate-binding protein